MRFMLLTDLKCAVKSLLAQKTLALISIIGLAVCFACALLLTRYLHLETSYDKFHSASDRLYRAWVHEDHGGEKQLTNVSTPIPLTQILKENFPEVEQVIRIDKVNIPFRHGESMVDEELHLVDASFLDSFDFEWLQGDRQSALSDIHQIILTPRLSEKYFGLESPLGKTLDIDTGESVESYTVSGVIAAPPANSTLQFQALIPFSERYYGEAANNWYSVNIETYVLLAQGVDTTELESGINELMIRVLGNSYPREHYEVHLQPMFSIHLDTTLPAGMAPLGDPLALGLVASGTVLLLLIASVNYTAICLGGIARRTREVGLRRSLGASWANIRQQFCVEAVIVCFIAMVLGLSLAELYLPVFNVLAAASVTLQPDLPLVGTCLVVGILFCLTTSNMPTWVLSSFRASSLLGDRLSFDSDKSLVMRALITFQFSLAIMMLVSSATVAVQMKYVGVKELGFNKDNVLVVRLPGDYEEATQVAERFIAEAASLQFVEGVSYVSAPPGEGIRELGYQDNQNIFRRFDAYATGPDFLAVMGMELVEGRSFNANSSMDAARALIVNESFVREYGWESGIDNTLPGRNFPEHEIIGVVKDAHFRPLTDAVVPTVFAMSFDLLGEGTSDSRSYSSPLPDLIVRLNGTTLTDAVASLEEVWGRVQSDNAFEYYLLDAALAAQYGQQTRFQEMIDSITLLTVAVSAMGLFALSWLMVGRRRKEIGVRKVMGGSVWSIVLLLTNDFSKLVLISNVIAWPVAYFAMSRWLEQFAYRIDLTPLVFIGSGLIALCIAWVTVGSTAAKAASQKPVLALRYE